MSFDWSEYLTLAHELAGQARVPSSQESKLRSAISRAYYAAFCCARNHVRDKELRAIPSKADAHQYVRNQFLNSRDHVRKKIGTNLGRMRTNRNKADYDDSVSELDRLAKKALIQSAEVMSVLSRI